MSIFTDTEHAIGSFQTALVLRRLENESMRDWQLSGDLQALQSLIASLQGCETAYNERIARQAALGNATPKLPKRLLREMLPADPVALVKVRHDSPLGHRFVNRIDFDPSTMELMPND